MRTWINIINNNNNNDNNICEKLQGGFKICSDDCNVINLWVGEWV